VHASEEIATIIIDTDGRIVSCVGGLRNLPANLKGKDWREAFSPIANVADLPAELPSYPKVFDLRGHDGNIITIQAAPTGIAGQDCTLALVRRSPSLADNDLQRERMVALGFLAASAAHEINNVLTLVLGWLQLLLTDEPDEERCKTLQLVIDSGDRLGMLTRNLLDFARAPLSKVGPVHLNDAVAAVLALIDYQLEKSNIRLHREFSRRLPLLEGNAAELVHACLNLVLNAMRAMPDGGKLTVRTYTDGDQICLEIEDTGCGMTEEMQQRIFKPYFSTHGDRGGAGLGLFVCSEIVARHSGEIKVRSEVNRGTTFALRFPAKTEKTADVLAS